MMVSLSVSAIIPTHRRSDKLLLSLRRILECDPAPTEVIVHVDGDDKDTAPSVRAHFPKVRLIESNERVGPGGGRNRLVHAALCPLIASFDDDSWPMDNDFFQTAKQIFASRADTVLLAATLCSGGEEEIPQSDDYFQVACFESGACIFRRDAFLQTTGFVPLHHAYGMEETDVSLQLLDAGWSIVKTSALRVYHDSELSHHVSPEINAAHITNTALLAFLRYPSQYWPLGIVQILNRVRYALRKGRWRGVTTGLLAIPQTLWRNRHFRHAVRPATLARSRALARVGVQVPR